MSVTLARIYDHDIPPGWKVLADRLWPRGVRKSDPRIDEWDKNVAPSSALRRWYAHDPELAQEFSRRYREELRDVPDELAALRARAQRGGLILLTATRVLELSHLIVLREVLLES